MTIGVLVVSPPPDPQTPTHRVPCSWWGPASCWAAIPGRLPRGSNEGTLLPLPHPPARRGGDLGAEGPRRATPPPCPHATGRASFGAELRAIAAACCAKVSRSHSSSSSSQEYKNTSVTFLSFSFSDFFFFLQFIKSFYQSSACSVKLLFRRAGCCGL